jgi:hypothetical protein
MRYDLGDVGVRASKRRFCPNEEAPPEIGVRSPLRTQKESVDEPYLILVVESK